MLQINSKWMRIPQVQALRVPCLRAVCSQAILSPSSNIQKYSETFINISVRKHSHLIFGTWFFFTSCSKFQGTKSEMTLVSKVIRFGNEHFAICAGKTIYQNGKLSLRCTATFMTSHRRHAFRGFVLKKDNNFSALPQIKFIQIWKITLSFRDDALSLYMW